MGRFRTWLKGRDKTKGVVTGLSDLEATAQEEERGSEGAPLATVRDDQMYSWESQAVQYPADGPPGISYFRGQLSDELHVDCLLYRDKNGELIGILNHYPSDIPPHERAGDENIWVHPGHRRQGVGSALLLEARVRWGRREGPGDPKLSESGAEWVQALNRRYGGTDFDWREVGWEEWLERRRQERDGPEADWRDLGWEFWHKRSGSGDHLRGVPERDLGSDTPSGDG